RSRRRRPRAGPCAAAAVRPRRGRRPAPRPRVAAVPRSAAGRRRPCPDVRAPSPPRRPPAVETPAQRRRRATPIPAREPPRLGSCTGISQSYRLTATRQRPKRPQPLPHTLEFHMPAIVLIGAQWGDEGKGKATDLLGDKVQWVVRYQGGNNAG